MKKCVLVVLGAMLAGVSLSAQEAPARGGRLTVGGLNNAHEPLNFFTVYRPEGEYTILPSTWHDTGISLWGRGLSKTNTGAEDRLHDNRARNVIEAIMWHGYSKQSDAYPATEKFYYLSASDREAVIAFIDAI